MLVEPAKLMTYFLHSLKEVSKWTSDEGVCKVNSIYIVTLNSNKSGMSDNFKQGLSTQCIIKNKLVRKESRK